MFYRNVGKRILDIFFALIGLLFSVVLFPIIAVLIVLDSPGPVFFLQKRVGLNGKEVSIYKFRTMVKDATSKGAGYYFETNDSRITKVGAFLRKTSLDELPQLLNILQGDMSIVGPRPQLPFIVEKYYSYYEPVLSVKPGLTGLAQVSGRTSLRRSQMVALDQEYAHIISFLTDAKIVLKTIQVVLQKSGVKTDVSEEFLEDLTPGTTNS